MIEMSEIRIQCVLPCLRSINTLIITLAWAFNSRDRGDRFRQEVWPKRKPRTASADVALYRTPFVPARAISATFMPFAFARAGSPTKTAGVALASHFRLLARLHSLAPLTPTLLHSDSASSKRAICMPANCSTDTSVSLAPSFTNVYVFHTFAVLNGPD